MIRVVEDREELAAVAADHFVECFQKAITERGRFTVALSGGHTPRRTYELLARPPRRERVDWSRVHVFWSDERCVPADDERHNGRMARELLLDPVSVPTAQVHAIECGEDSEAAATAYEHVLLEALGPDDPRLDLVLLGLGKDGHTASLFPGGAAILEEERRVMAVPATRSGDIARVTFTPRFLREARDLVFLVEGASKAEALHAVLRELPDPRRWPAQSVSRHEEKVLWIVDRQAAGRLDLAAEDGEAPA